MRDILALPIGDASVFQSELEEGVRLYMVDYLLPSRATAADDKPCLRAIQEKSQRDGLTPFKVGAVESEQSIGRTRTIAALAKRL